MSYTKEVRYSKGEEDMTHTKTKALIAALLLSTLALTGVQANAEVGGSDTRTVTNRPEEPIEMSDLSIKAVALGNALNKEQQTATLNALETGGEVPIFTTNGKDLMKYIPQGNFKEDWAVYSSVYVETQEEGTGIDVVISTPDNITSITPAQYKSAAQTAGLTDVKLTVASIVPIDGSGALAGVYKTVESSGGFIDPTRTAVAQEEMNILNQITENNKDVPGFTDTALNIAQEQIKTVLAGKVKDGDKITDKVIETTVREALESQGLQLSTTEQENLTQVLGQMQDANIFDKLSNEISTEKLNELKEQSKGFIAKAGSFFQSIWTTFLDFITPNNAETTDSTQ